MNEKNTNCRICNKEFTDKEHVNLLNKEKDKTYLREPE